MTTRSPPGAAFQTLSTPARKGSSSGAVMDSAENVVPAGAHVSCAWCDYSTRAAEANADRRQARPGHSALGCTESRASRCFSLDPPVDPCSVTSDCSRRRVRATPRHGDRERPARGRG
jgi:hypothetical protein